MLNVMAVFTTESRNPELVKRVSGFRHRLFVEQLGWDLISHEGLERDQFDLENTIHMALIYNNQIVASFRANCTLNPYLCEVVFNSLSEFRPYPKQPDIWEISRFGVDASNPRIKFEIARMTYALMFHFATAYRLRALVAAADLAYERFLARLDITTRRYGPPKAVCNDARGRPIEMVAGEIPLAAQSGRTLADLSRLIRDLEIVDEAHVLGSQAIPA